MLDNHVYNLINQLVQEHKSLWRIKNMYMKDAGDCEECADFWNKMAEEKAKRIEELKEHFVSHI